MNDSTSDDSTPTQPALLAAWLEALPEPHIVFDHDYRIVAGHLGTEALDYRTGWLTQPDY